jgi:hypothetical protein
MKNDTRKHKGMERIGIGIGICLKEREKEKEKEKEKKMLQILVSKEVIRRGSRHPNEILEVEDDSSSMRTSHE